jgi:hypothetical protein
MPPILVFVTFRVARSAARVRGPSTVDEKAFLVILAVIGGVALELTVGAAIRRRRRTMLRQVRIIPAAEFVALMGIAVGMSFVIVFMLGPALGEMLRFGTP